MSSQAKILFVLHVPPPVHGSSIVGEFIKKSSLINSVFISRYINLGTSKSIGEIGKNGIKKWLIYFKILFSVIKQLITFKPNMVYLAMTAKGIGFYKDMLVALFVKLFRLQLVIHFHNKGVRDNQHKALDNFLYKLVFKNTKVILLSNYLYPDIQKYVKEDNVYYCPNGIPAVQLKENNTKNKTVQLLFLSNLIVSKGVYILLNALSQLKNKGVNFVCNFVGGVGDISEDSFNKRLSDLQLDTRVNYLGKKFNEDKVVVFNQADIFVHPTFNDCFPLVLLEASQFSLPMVSTLEGAIPEIIEDGVNGFLVPQKDAQALADKLEVLIKNPQQRTDMGHAGRAKYIKYFTLEHFENNFVHCLKQILSNHG